MRVKTLAQAIAAIGLLGSGFAHAADDNQLERVTITGSNIKRINKEGPTAVETIKRADIEKSGANTVVELLEKVPSITGVMTGSSQTSFAKGAASASLRGMGEKYTLVLLNGRRIANYGFANGASSTFVDLNSLPLQAIERVEILRDGASAIYGSDAVAGVVNFITRKNYQGTDLSVRNAGNQGGDGQAVSGNITTGIGDLDKDGYNLLVTADLFHREASFKRDHDLTQTADYRRFGGTLGYLSTLYPGSVRDIKAADSQAIPGCPPSRIGLNALGLTRCLYDPAQYQEMEPRTSRFGISTVLTKKLSADSELFAELGFNHNETIYHQDYPSFDTATGRLNPSAGMYPGKSRDPAVNVIGGGVNPVQVYRAVYENGRVQDTTTGDSYRGVFGWRGLWRGWDVESALSASESSVKTDRTNQLLKDATVNALQNGSRTLGTGYDPFVMKNPLSNVLPLLTTTHRKATSKLQGLDFKMGNGEMFDLPGGKAGFAWGAQYSHESINDQPDPQTVANNIINTGATMAKGSRNVYSLYGEFSLPLRKNLEVQLALRGDHYSDFGNTVNPKVAFSYKPWDQLLLRGSATTSFKAPTLPEEYASTQAYDNSLIDVKRCRIMGGSYCKVSSTRVNITGGSNLKPEKATNLSFGFVLQPTKDLSASVDFYSVRSRDTIDMISTSYIMANEGRGGPGKVYRDPALPGDLAKYPGLQPGDGAVNLIDVPYANLGSTITTGYDVGLQYELSLGGYGKLRFRDDLNNIMSFRKSDTQDSAAVNQLDNVSQPKWRNVFSTTYSYDRYDLMLTARSYAGTRDVLDSSAQDASSRIPSYTMWDLAFTARPLKNLVVNAGVNNVFGRSVPFSVAANDFVGSTQDLYGRSYFVSARYTFK
ncbi:TonB-dependent receptor plug domain-containing protein [Chromobacterium violaceum]|uniref:TonB-dependent receptor plug domain-containing protein n=1 Tax=Chromobacterium violaceum TaxID=536 RepID=UPI0009D9E780|nr:TonB-dependent receptor [Chromobacterium violaceum]OQS50693.1 hypothetical protein B0T48_03485 [Chromobacterium violaceum]OQS52878.1 hypothetical protein B0T49_03485 [Chromobacterium violaceum]QRO31742.1 TonB-dependent receptor [Chromobacterium violaceum]QRQ18458.1 TonB-dependent receptor [Chromobacterium violaceum]